MLIQLPFCEIRANVPNADAKPETSRPTVSVFWASSLVSDAASAMSAGRLWFVQLVEAGRPPSP